MAKPVANGANIFLWNSKGEVLTQTMGTNYPSPGLIFFPGGRMNPGNRPAEAAARELMEETGLTVDWRRLRLIGTVAQSPTGQVFICDGNECSGELTTSKGGEIASTRFMSVAEILANRDKVHRSYMYMFIQYMRCIRGFDPIPCQGRISEAILWPALLGEEEFVLPRRA